MVGERRWGVVTGTLTVAALVMLLFPVYWMFRSCLETQIQLFHDPPYIIPPTPSLSAFRSVFPDVAPALMHSLILAVGCVVVTLVVAAPTGFALAHLKIRGHSLLLLVVLLATMFPAIMYVIPLFITFNRVGLLNTYAGVIIADSIYSVPLGVIITYSYMKTIPGALLESARVDGASLLRAFTVIILPIARPALITSAIFAFLGGWGDFLFALTFTNGQNIIPASVAVYNYVAQSKVIEWDYLMSAAALVALPVAVMLIIGHSFISAGLSAGAMKG